MDEPNVTPIQWKHPTEVTLTAQDQQVRFTPRELALIKEQYGRALSALVADDESDDKLVVLAWLKLRREGYPLTLDDMLDVIVTLGDDAPDPTSAGHSMTSQPSAGSGA